MGFPVALSGSYGILTRDIWPSASAVEQRWNGEKAIAKSRLPNADILRPEIFQFVHRRHPQGEPLFLASLLTLAVWTRLGDVWYNLSGMKVAV